MGLTVILLTESHCQPLQMKPLVLTTVDYRTIEVWDVSPDSTIATNANEKQPVGKRSNLFISLNPYITVHYYGYLGPIAKALGYKNVIFDVRKRHNGHT